MNEQTVRQQQHFVAMAQSSSFQAHEFYCQLLTSNYSASNPLGMTKLFTSMLLTFAAASSFACPELSGNFDCTSDSGPVNSFTIKKSSERGQVIYYINGTKLVPNGVPETRSKGDGFPTTYTTSCEGETLRARMQTQVSSAICPTMPLAVDSMTLFTRQGKDIVMDDLTILNCLGKDPMTIHHKYFCTKK